MMKSQKAGTILHILSKMNETGVTMLQNIIYKLLHNTVNDQFFFWFQSVFVFMKAAAGVDLSRSAYFLEHVRCRLEKALGTALLYNFTTTLSLFDCITPPANASCETLAALAGSIFE